MLSRLNSQKSDTQCYAEAIGRCQSGLGPGPYSSSMFGGLEESEVVDELLQILVECMKQADMRGQEILLRKFFFEIEKEMPLERFLVERLKQSKISSLFDTIPARSDDGERLFRPEMEISTREINVTECDGETTSEKLERFKIKTVQIGVVVKEETSR